MEISGDNNLVEPKPVTAEMIKKALEEAANLWKICIEEDLRRYEKALLN